MRLLIIVAVAALAARSNVAAVAVPPEGSVTTLSAAAATPIQSTATSMAAAPAEPNAREVPPLEKLRLEEYGQIEPEGELDIIVKANGHVCNPPTGCWAQLWMSANCRCGEKFPWDNTD